MRHPRFRWWLALAAAVILAGFAAFAALGSAVSIFSARHGGAGLGTSITTGVISIAVLIVCVRWAVHVEHRLRTPAAAGHNGHPGGRRPSPGRPGPRGQRIRLYHHRYGPDHHRYGPVATTIGALLFTLIGTGMLAGAVLSFSQWRLSGYVQAHGTLTPATVLWVHNIKHPRRSRTWYTAEIRVTLQRPVHGGTAATVYSPHASELLPGETATVRVDPQRPGYAEFPGMPYGNISSWLSLAFFAPMTLLAAAAFWTDLAIRVRQRHRPASLAVPAGTSP